MKNKIPIIVLILLALIGIVNAGSMTRTVPSTSTGNFNIIYTATESGTWGASIVETVSGGCTFSDGKTAYQSVFLSSDGSTKTVLVKRNNANSCTFNGDYKFGTDSIQTFPESKITFSSFGGDTTDDDCNAPKVMCRTGDTFQCLDKCPAPEGFCLDFTQDLDWLQKISGSTDCQTNSIMLIIGVVLILVVILMIAK